MTVLINPIMFGSIMSRAYFLYAGLNLLWIPVVYFLYPETAGRSLESIDALFSTKSPFYRAQERAYRERVEEKWGENEGEKSSGSVQVEQ